jgi:hypothetical protein
MACGASPESVNVARSKLCQNSAPAARRHTIHNQRPKTALAHTHTEHRVTEREQELTK